MNDERLHIPEGIPETRREIKEKKEAIKEKAAAEGSPDAGGEGGPPV
jgi:hypothetical protein